MSIVECDFGLDEAFDIWQKVGEGGVFFVDPTRDL